MNEQISTPPLKPQENFKSSDGVLRKRYSIAGGIVFILMIIGITVFLITKPYIFNSQSTPIPPTIAPTSTIPLETKYNNPFDEKSHYQNPFSESENYKNPFGE